MAEKPLMENLAVAQAVYKVVSAAVKTGDPDNLRGQADAQLMELYEMGKSLGMPTKSVDLTVGDAKVGTVSVIEKGGESKQVYDLTDGEAFERWLWNNSEDVTLYVSEHGSDFCQWLMRKTGEIPDGVTVRSVETPTKVTTSVRVDPKKVAVALEKRDELPTVLAGLLEA